MTWFGDIGWSPVEWVAKIESVRKEMCNGIFSSSNISSDQSSFSRPLPGEEWYPREYLSKLRFEERKINISDEWCFKRAYAVPGAVSVAASVPKSLSRRMAYKALLLVRSKGIFDTLKRVLPKGLRRRMVNFATK
jgi:hypothetical protein